MDINRVIMKLEVIDAVYWRFLKDTTELAAEHRKNADREHDPFLAGYKAGIAQAFESMRDEHLGLYHEICVLKELLGKGAYQKSHHHDTRTQHASEGDDFHAVARV